MLINEMLKVVMVVPAVRQVSLWLFLLQKESNPQGLLAQQREIGWRLHCQGYIKERQLEHRVNTENTDVFL